ncbi:MAG: T9SS type A sorting domain-containing protein [Muribaculaceae bacterium]|nr:T9SS type A sorting domain-containing protein [Muribaculaceae bacterium]
MKQNLKLLASGVLFISALPAVATGPQLVFAGTEQTRIFSLADVSRVTFGESGLIVTAGTSEEFPYSSFQRLVFDYDGTYTEPTSIEQVTAVKTGKFIYDFQAATIAFTGFETRPTAVEIYSATGARILSVPQYREGTIDISGLTPGVYIVRTNVSSAKFIKK